LRARRYDDPAAAPRTWIAARGGGAYRDRRPRRRARRRVSPVARRATLRTAGGWEGHALRARRYDDPAASPRTRITARGGGAYRNRRPRERARRRVSPVARRATLRTAGVWEGHALRARRYDDPAAAPRTWIAARGGGAYRDRRPRERARRRVSPVARRATLRTAGVWEGHALRARRYDDPAASPPRRITARGGGAYRDRRPRERARRRVSPVARRATLRTAGVWEGHALRARRYDDPAASPPRRIAARGGGAYRNRRPRERARRRVSPVARSATLRTAGGWEGHALRARRYDDPAAAPRTWIAARGGGAYRDRRPRRRARRRVSPVARRATLRTAGVWEGHALRARRYDDPAAAPRTWIAARGGGAYRDRRPRRRARRRVSPVARRATLRTAGVWEGHALRARRYDDPAAAPRTWIAARGGGAYRDRRPRRRARRRVSPVARSATLRTTGGWEGHALRARRYDDPAAAPRTWIAARGGGAYRDRRPRRRARRRVSPVARRATLRTTGRIGHAAGEGHAPSATGSGTMRRPERE
jgi:hypothetical protein